MPPLSLSTGPGSVSVRVQPAVLLNICDAFMRRNSKQNRVIGTLLGYSADGFLEVKSCYAVPHQHTPESIDFDVLQHQTMKELHQRVNPREAVVGWFTTGTGEDLSNKDVLVQNFYDDECQNPIVLCVDTELRNERLDVTAYVTRQLKLKDTTLATDFRPVECEVRGVELEKLGGEVFGGAADRPLGDIDTLTLATTALSDSLGKVSEYVDAVVRGDVKGDPRVGRFLADTVAAVPRLSAAEVDRLVSDSAQDALLIVYLANLVRTQLALADKLGTAALPIL